MNRFFAFLLSVFCLSNNFAQSKKQLDSINELIEISKDKNLSLEERFSAANKSTELAKKTRNDSILLLNNRSLALLHFDAKDYDSYVKLNKQNLLLAKKLVDSSAVTVASSNIGSYYRFTEKNDSSYYYYSLAISHYKPFEVSERKGTALLYLADLQEIEKIYLGAEEDAIKAILIFEQLPETENTLYKLWSLHNLMGIISKELKNFDASIEYYDKALSYSKKFEGGFINEVLSINNKAYVYRLKGDFQKSIDLYKSLLPLKNRYEEEEPTFYATVLGNIADTRLESGDTNFEDLTKILDEAYKISVDFEDEISVMNIGLYLSKLYLKKKEIDSVMKYAQESYNIGKRVSANNIVLESLLNLAEAKKGNESVNYFKEYARLNDSLSNVEQSTRNKFARTKYETDKLEEENQQISKENRYLLILSGALLMLGLLTYVVITQRAKNRQLRLVQAQQKANEEIYNLMLNQQDKVEEARAQEKIRVSKELHDGVLGRLFGTRLSLDSLNFVEGKEAIQNRANYIGQLKTIEEDIRKISHEMNADFVSGSGFMDIVSELIENQTKAYGLAYNFNYTDDINWDMVTNKTKINSYRIVQESMQNIYKHAEAKHINISFSLKNNVICLYIADDGKGFDTSKGKKGIGLKNMTSRVADIDGKIEFASQVNKGTEVKVKIPYIT